MEGWKAKKETVARRNGRNLCTKEAGGSIRIDMNIFVDIATCRSVVT